MQTVLCTDKLHAAGLQLRASSAVAGNETLEALRHRQWLEARAAEEEDLMVRVPLSKEQKKQLKADRRVNLSGAAMMNDFADDVADLVGVSILLHRHRCFKRYSRRIYLTANSEMVGRRERHKQMFACVHQPVT